MGASSNFNSSECDLAVVWCERRAKMGFVVNTRVVKAKGELEVDPEQEQMF